MTTPTMNRMLINATHREELRVAMIKDDRLDNVFIEHPGNQKKGNVYKGRITRIEPSLQAAFVDFGSERHGFLPLKEISSFYFNKKPASDNSFSINEVLREGQELIVQVDKEERGNKGAALTTFITLAGCYLVLMANNPRAGGISRRIEGEERDELKNILNALDIPNHMGVIVRTAGVGKSQEELQWDLDILLRLWDAIKRAGHGEGDGAKNTQVSSKAPYLIHQESNFTIRAIRDYLRKDTDEIIIDNTAVYEQVKQHIERVRPEFLDRIHLYQNSISLFIKFGIESQIETAFQPEVRLPSGGSIVIQNTEAMVTIDVNSAKDTKGGNIEATALNTNREAAIEVARQLRIRDIGGLIAVDFIDMLSQDNQREIVNTFQQAIKNDRARVQYNRISKFGLLEISRQRLRPSLVESSQIVCPRCNGQGTIRHIESLSFFIIRILRQEALLHDIKEIIAHLPIEVATFLLNEKRQIITEIEQHHQLRILLIPTPSLETPHYKIDKRFKDQIRYDNSPSYTVQYHTPNLPHEPKQSVDKQQAIEAPRISDILPHARPQFSQKTGIFKQLIGLICKKSSKKPHGSAQKTSQENKHHSRHHRAKSNKKHRSRRHTHSSKSKKDHHGRLDDRRK